MSSTMTTDHISRANYAEPLADSVVAAIQVWLSDYLAHILDVAPEQIDPDIKFDRHGLDSSAAVGLAGDLGAWIGCEFDPALTYDFPTIAELAAELGRRDEVRSALKSRI